MKFLVLIFLVNFSAHASDDVLIDLNSYGAFTAPRDISLYEEEGGALLIDENGIQCTLTQADYDANDKKVLIKKGTTIIFGDYQVTGDHSSGVGVSWMALNSPDIGELDCWLDHSREGLQLTEIIAEILANPY